MAAFLAAGIGSFAVGAITFLSGIDLVSVPAIYGPAGGVSGRTTLAIVVWLAAWITLHLRWKGRTVESRPVSAATLVLVALGIVGTFPPLWELF